MSKDNFVRFDADVAGDVFTLGHASRPTLAGFAAGQSRILGPVHTERFADHVARPYTAIPSPRTESDTQTPAGDKS